MKHFFSQNKGKLILSSLSILLPAVLALLFPNLFAQMASVNWGERDAIGGVGIFAYFLPFIFLALHLGALALTAKDLENRPPQSRKVIALIFWILPLFHLLFWGMILCTVFFHKTSLALPLTFTTLGILFLVMGNYMPKCRQNATMGIKMATTLSNEENWNATHRFAGKLWVIGGFLCVPIGFLPLSLLPIFGTLLILLMVLPPVIYSLRYYRRQYERGEVPQKPTTTMQKSQKTAILVAIPILVVTLGLCGILMFTGSIEIRLDTDALCVEASYSEDIHLNYDAIDRIEFVESDRNATRIVGFGSPKLSMGSFHSDILGDHTRYCYTQCDSVIAIYSEDRILVINAEDEAQTRALFEALQEKIEEEVTQ